MIFKPLGVLEAVCSNGCKMSDEHIEIGKEFKIVFWSTDKFSHAQVRIMLCRLNLKRPLKFKMFEADVAASQLFCERGFEEARLHEAIADDSDVEFTHRARLRLSKPNPNSVYCFFASLVEVDCRVICTTMQDRFLKNCELETSTFRRHRPLSGFKQCYCLVIKCSFEQMRNC